MKKLGGNALKKLTAIAIVLALLVTSFATMDTSSAKVKKAPKPKISVTKVNKATKKYSSYNKKTKKTTYYIQYENVALIRVTPQYIGMGTYVYFNDKNKMKTKNGRYWLVYLRNGYGLGYSKMKISAWTDSKAGCLPSDTAATALVASKWRANKTTKKVTRATYDKTPVATVSYMF